LRVVDRRLGSTPLPFSASDRCSPPYAAATFGFCCSAGGAVQKFPAHCRAL
jgi:hypothetical protein